MGDRRGEVVVLLRIVPIYLQLGQSEKAASSTQQLKALSIALSTENAKPNTGTPKALKTSEDKPNNPDGSDLEGFKPNLSGNVLENLQDLDS